MQKVRIWAKMPAEWIQLTPTMFQFQLDEWRINGRLFVNSQFGVVGEWDGERAFREGEYPCAVMLVDRIFRGNPRRGKATIKCTLLRVIDEEQWSEVKKNIKIRF